MNEVHPRTFADLKDCPLRKRDEALPDLLYRFWIPQHANEMVIDMIFVKGHGCLSRSPSA
jgi:hypothetical protein